jgi:prepilin-type N-terminal cleavage/methylation domain-containing protein
MNGNLRHARARGFTLIELLIALVVGGLLMAVLVALSGSVQRSFGRSKEINDLQTNMRFAMKTLVDDMSRISYMQSPDPVADYCHRFPGGLDNASLNAAIVWSDPVLELWGNYVSPRDYLWNQQKRTISCRNEIDSDEPDFADCGGYENYLMPFADGPAVIENVFCPGEVVRIDVGDRKYLYESVASIAPPWGLEMNVDPNQVKGNHLWINPLNNVQYQVQQDLAYAPLYAPATAAANNWQLVRRLTACRNGALTAGQNVVLADFLLPPNDPVAGLQIDFIEDTNSLICSLATAPALSAPTTFLPNTGAAPNPIQARAMIVTLRGRTETEDPVYTINNYAARPDRPQRYGVNLDGDPQNGLAHVREVRTVIQLRNLGLNLNI